MIFIFDIILFLIFDLSLAAQELPSVCFGLKILLSILIARDRAKLVARARNPFDLIAFSFCL